MVRLALIGLGRIARYQIEALSQVEAMDLVAAHDVDPEQAAILPHGVPFFSDLEDLLKGSGADLVMVSTPTATHYGLGQRVLVSGTALLLEKPCCETAEELDDLLNIAARAGQFFAVALHAAYARDLLWYLERLAWGEMDFGPLTGFYAGFFDPYYQQGEIVPGARGLGGSWFDSGINALSVMGRLIPPADLQLIEGRMTIIDSLACSEVQGSATFRYPHEGFTGHGIIDTNWTLGLNRKTTHLYYGTANTEVILDHSTESLSVNRDGIKVLERRFRGERPRLTNHYTNLFRDVAARFSRGEDNREHAAALHRLLFAAGARR